MPSGSSAMKKRQRGKGLPSPCPTPFIEIPSGRPYFFRRDDFTDNVSCLRFEAVDAEELPGESLQYFSGIATSVSETVAKTVHADLSLLFFVFTKPKTPAALQRLLKTEFLILPGTDLKFRVTHGSIEDAVQGCFSSGGFDTNSLENAVSDFKTPPTTDDDEEPELPRKSVAKPRLRAAAPLPAAPALPAQPPAAQPGPSTSTSASGQPLAATLPAATPQPASRQPRRRRFRFKEVDFSQLKVTLPPPAPRVTVLFRPVNPAEDLRKANPLKMAKALESFGEQLAVRDIRGGGLAVDFPPETPLEPLLAVTSLLTIPVTCSTPAMSNTVFAAVSGVHPDLTVEDILRDLRTSPPVKILAVKRLAKPGQVGWSIKLTIEGSTIPEKALLYGRSRRVAPLKSKPLQCSKCGRFGHTAAVCRSSQRCWVCGLGHETSACPSPASPKCPNCSGPHSADSAACQSRRMEQKICKVKAESQSTFREARVAVQAAAKTYAAAARAPVPHNRPPQLVQEPPLKGGFLPSTPHHRPPPAASPSLVTHATLAALFTGFLSILEAAITSGNLAEATAATTALFQSHAPGAHTQA